MAFAQLPALQLSRGTDLFDYQFYGLQVDTKDEAIHFVDSWGSLAETPLDSYKMSYQLVTADWDNVAQLDCHLYMKMFHVDFLSISARYLPVRIGWWQSCTMRIRMSG